MILVLRCPQVHVMHVMGPKYVVEVRGVGRIGTWPRVG